MGASDGDALQQGVRGLGGELMAEYDANAMCDRYLHRLILACKHIAEVTGSCPHDTYGVPLPWCEAECDRMEPYRCWMEHFSDEQRREWGEPTMYERRDA